VRPQRRWFDAGLLAEVIASTQIPRCRLRDCSCLAFLVGCIWVALFPLVSISTGELKPRGTFTAENAIQGAAANQKFDMAAVSGVWACTLLRCSHSC